MDFTEDSGDFLSSVLYNQAKWGCIWVGFAMGWLYNKDNSTNKAFNKGSCLIVLILFCSVAGWSVVWLRACILNVCRIYKHWTTLTCYRICMFWRISMCWGIYKVFTQKEVPSSHSSGALIWGSMVILPCLGCLSWSQMSVIQREEGKLC